MTHEEHKRSIAKTITWRICATLTTFGLVWLFVGDLTLAFSVGFFEVIIEMFVYYVHERVWNHNNWGLAKPVGSEE